VRTTLLRLLLLLIGIAELVRALLFLLRQPLAYDLLQLPLIDPLISRQYGLFLLPVALLCCILARDPVRFSRLIWVVVAQRAVEIALACADWFLGDLPTASFRVILVIDVLLLLALIVLNRGESHVSPVEERQRYRGMRRLLRSFGVLFLFWAVASTIVLQVGSWLLSYPVQDPYTTKQQGVTFLVLGLTSWLAANDVSRYRLLIWVPLSSQILGIFNSAYESYIGTVPLTGAMVQWTIQAAIIALFIWLYPRGEDDWSPPMTIEGVPTPRHVLGSSDDNYSPSPSLGERRGG